MNTRLTLTIDQSLVEKAKKLTPVKGRSLSDIIENYLKVIAKDDNFANDDLSPIVRSLKGSFKAPDHFDYKKELSERLTRKYVNNA